MADREITVAETARRLGVTLTHTYSLIWAGKLKARKKMSQWLVSAEAVEARLKARAE